MAPLLQCKDVHVAYPGKGWGASPIKILKGVSLDIHRGETVGLVGESGSGKTTLGRAVLGFAPVTGGQILMGGQDYAQVPLAKRRHMASELQVIFQDPYTSLNPAMTIEEILSEPLVVNKVDNPKKVIGELLERVNLPTNSGGRLAREFSGGQRQRIAIARALALRPKLIICDEPTSALDLSTQRKVIDLLLEIQEQTQVAYLFITHDLSVVRAISHRIAVMFDGEIVEQGSAEKITTNPDHPYTQRLLMASPVANPAEQRQRRTARQELLARQHAEGEDRWVVASA
jgi:peptide/nickel transport system ATP-binding protein